MENLKTILKVNSISSGLCGLLLILLPQLFSDIFQIPGNNYFQAVGVFLILFAGFVYYHSAQRESSAGGVTAIILLDITWVVGSIVLVLLNPFHFSVEGRIAVTVIAAWVGLMAVLQNRGLKKSKIV